MSQFEFQRDAEAEAFCCEVVGQMVTDFGISDEEAVARVNQLWKGLRLEGEDLIYHESVAYWAWQMYYGGDSLWWIQGEERMRQGLPVLQPQSLG